MLKFWYRMRSRLSAAPTVLLVEGGSVELVKGQLPPSLLAELAEVAADSEGEGGVIAVSRSGKELRFTGRFSSSAKQRFRNVWFS